MSEHATPRPLQADQPALFTLSHVSVCPSDKNFAYVHVQEKLPRSKFFVPLERAIQAGLVFGETALVEGADLLKWQEEASKAYNTPGRVSAKELPEGLAEIRYAAPSRNDDRKLTVSVAGVDASMTLHPDTLAQTEGLDGMARVQKGQIVTEACLKAAVERSVNAFKGTKTNQVGYYKKDWAREAYSTGRLQTLIEAAFPGVGLQFTPLGKGTGGTDVIDNNTLDDREAGVPDLVITNPENGKSVLLECTGSEFAGKKKGFHLREDTCETYPEGGAFAKPGDEPRHKYAELWVRPDKITWARNHPEHKVYVGFHFPQEKLEYDNSDPENPAVMTPKAPEQNEIVGFILPDPGKRYPAYNWENPAKKMTERFCAFFMKDPEYLSPRDFLKSLAKDLDVPLDRVKPGRYRETGPSQGSYQRTSSVDRGR